MCGTTSLYGWLMVAYSGAQVVGSPLFAMWADRRNVKEALLVSLGFLFVGNLVYALVPLGVEPTCDLANGSVCVPLFVNENVTLPSGGWKIERRTAADALVCNQDRGFALTMLFVARVIAGLGGG